MNNNPENNKNENNIDDVLDILQKRKEQDIKNNSFSDSAPTRVDNQVVNTPKPAPKPAPVPPRVSPAATSAAQQAKKPVAPSAHTTQNKAASNTTAGVSLSDFDAIRTHRPQQKSTNKKFTVPRFVKVIIYIVSVLSVSILLSLSIIFVANDVFAFKKLDKEITITIKEDATLKDVAEELKNQNVIEYPLIFRIYSKMKMDKSDYYSGDFIEGEHILNSNLGYDKFIAQLAESAYSTEVVRVTIPEGYTASEIIDLFVKKKVIRKSDKDKFEKKLNLAVYEYDFLKEFDEAKDENGKVDSECLYLLEGYLFPDTYDFYVGEDHTSIIEKLLGNFDKKFEETYYERCEQLGLTINEAITLASMIEAEGNNAEDLYKISSVFHNRLKNNGAYPYLNSDATTVYVLQEIKDRKDITAEDITKYDSPYNTYLNKGLPPGPICNPGVEAIHAALYPDATGYYYFYTASSNGVTYFSSNESQHNSYIQKDKNGTLD